MFIKATLRTRELPFVVTDIQSEKHTRKAFKDIFKATQEQAVINGTSNMTMDEINAEIKAYRQKKRTS